VVDSWFAPISLLEHNDERVRLAVPDEQFKEYLYEHHFERIRASLQAIVGDEIEVELCTASSHLGGRQRASSSGRRSAIKSGPLQGILPLAGAGKPNRRADQLIDFLTFDSFVVGHSNELAHAAAIAVSEAPSTTFNPLFLHGGVGIGKTHLLHAIGLAVRARLPEYRILYVPSASYIDDTISAIRSSSTTARTKLRERYRDIDLLLIDDIQFMQGKEKTQEEFFHTFNALHQGRKQIIFTSDRFPSELDNFQDRLRSRFAWGLVAEIQAPDREMRIAILQRKAKAARLTLPLDVTHYLSDHLRNNVRELEGALNKLMAHGRISDRPIDMSLAHDVLAPIIELPSRSLTTETIQRAIAKQFGLEITDLKGGKRTRRVVHPRMIAMYLVRKHTEHSYPEIGQAFGGRDHSTAINAYKKISWRLKHDIVLQSNVQALELSLGK
jgi:chromosomal replication initiator protein